jgi:hypothetical protein
MRSTRRPSCSGPGWPSDVEKWWRTLDDRAHDPADPINPELVAHEFSPRIPDNAILTADSGSGTTGGPGT